MTDSPLIELHPTLTPGIAVVHRDITTFPSIHTSVRADADYRVIPALNAIKE